MPSRLRARDLYALGVAIWCALASTLQAAIDVGAIQAAIDSLGYNWIAEETALTRLSGDRLAASLGDIPEDAGWGVDARTGIISPLVRSLPAPEGPARDRDLPPSLDWRSYGGQNWVTVPKDQMQCGSCWDFSLVGAWESRMQIERGEPVPSVDKSEQFILSCSPGTCTGWGRDAAAGFVYTTGCPDESCFPYGPPYDARPCSEACPNWIDSADTLNTGAYLTTGDSVPTPDQVIAIKTALLDGPVTTHMRVYEDFVSYGGGIYQYASGGYLGGHAVVFVGWADTTTPPCWIGKNSWGTWWGEGGFFYIAMGEATSLIGSWTHEIQHYERDHEMQLSVEDTLSMAGLGSPSPTVWYGGVKYTMPVSGRVVAVMTRFQEMSMGYTAYVYNGISGGGAPGALLTSQSGSFGSTLGWKRIDLDVPVHVNAESTVFAAVRYATIPYALPLESLDPAHNSGYSWYSSSGSTYAKLTSYGDVCIRVVVATASPAPPDTVALLAAAASGADVHLAWSPVTTDTTGAPTIIANYRVYRSTFAQFDESSASIVGTPTGITFTDPGAVGNESVNYYYAVVAVDDFGTPSLLGRRVGEFDRDLP